jgi:hypothetical protein
VLLIVNRGEGATFLEMREEADEERGEYSRLHEFGDQQCSALVVQFEISVVHRHAEIDLLIYWRAYGGRFLKGAPNGSSEELLYLTMPETIRKGF